MGSIQLTCICNSANESAMNQLFNVKKTASSIKFSQSKVHYCFFCTFIRSLELSVILSSKRFFVSSDARLCNAGAAGQPSTTPH